MMVMAIRGAITVSKNSSEEIQDAAVELVKQIISRNGLSLENIISVLFTCTGDLDSVYPAAGLRKIGINNIPMLCAADMPVKGSLEKCIRVMMLVNAEKNQRVRHVYLKDAKKLRPDLSEG